MTEPSPAGAPSDARLIKACQNGDAEAFRLLYQRHQGIVRSTLFHLCDGHTLDDLVQDVFLRAWKGIGKMRSDAKFSTWIYRIAWNVGSDYRKQIAKTLSKRERLTLNTAHPSNQDWQTLHHQDLVSRGLRTLKESHAMVIILHDLEELPQPEIARILEIPVGTVKSRLFHARAQLRKFFEQQGVSL